MTGDPDRPGPPAEPGPRTRVGRWCATYARAVAVLSPVERARLHRLATGTGCAACGRHAMEGAPHCRGCAVEASG